MFGKSKKKQAAQQAAQTQQMQVSPEALALLQAMQAQQMQAQQLQAQAIQAQQLQAMQAQQAMQMQMPQQPVMPAALAMPAAPVMPAMPAMPAAPAMPEQDLIAEVGSAPMATPQIPQQATPLADGQMAFAPQQPLAQPVMQAGMTPQMPDTDGAPIGKAKKAKLSKEQKRALAAQKKAEKDRKKAEKKAVALEKAEEKKRAKRRKKLAKTRFSRARYLREANGNALAGVVLWIFFILAFIIGPFMMNTAFLIPQTNENMRILSEVENLERSIIINRPQIKAMADKRKDKESQISAFTASFIPQTTAETLLKTLETQLEETGLVIEPISVTSTPLAANSIIGTSAIYTITGNYLDWLRVRNRFVRSQTAISIPNESVRVNNETGQMEITAQIVLPSSR